MNSRVNVGRIERWLSLLVGGALEAYAFKRRRGQRGRMVAMAGAGLLHRGVTGHCGVYRVLGINRARRGDARRLANPTPGVRQHGTGVLADLGSHTRQDLGGHAGMHVDESITINRPVAQVFRFWRNFENLPTFMKHLDSVAVREAGVSHWVARGPAGTKVEWDARVINEIDNKVIGWQSLDGSTISSAGSVNFRETGNGTHVRVRLQYKPPAGRLGAGVAWLFGEEPTIQIREDLRRLKELLETGRISSGAPKLIASNR